MGTSNKAWLKGQKQHSSSHKVEGCGSSLPDNRRARSSCGLHREVGPVPGKEFCHHMWPVKSLSWKELWALILLFIRSNSQPCRRQDSTGTGSSLWPTMVSLAFFWYQQKDIISMSKYSEKLLFTSTWNTHREIVKYTTSSKNLSRSTLF